MRFSKRSHFCARSRAACASSARPVSAALAWSRASSSVRTCSSLAGDHVHRELLEVRLVERVELVERRDVLEQRALVTLEGGRDLADVLLDCGIARAQRLEVVLRLVEDGERAGLLLLVGVEVLKRHDEGADVVADLAEVVVAHAVKRSLGEVRDLLLCADAEGEDARRVREVDLLDEGLDLLALGGGEGLGRVA